MSDTVSQRPNHTALIFKGRRLSYSELEKLSDAFANALVALGVKKGDRVAQLLFHTAERPVLESLKSLPVTERGEKGYGSSGK